MDKKENRQLANTILMIRPVKFGYNRETAVNNLYQKELRSLSAEDIQQRALAEFNGFVHKLTEAGIQVIAIDDTPETDTPDSIFPNNWISFHEDGTVVTYPMWAPNRRLERRSDILDLLTHEYGFSISRKIDYSSFEQEEMFLEGTGSMVLDRQNKIAYACISPRTHQELLEQFCYEFGYEPEIFVASQMAEGGFADIYHTNVMMSVGENIAVLCAEAIRNETERDKVIRRLKETGKEIIYIAERQANRFAGNMLQVLNKEGKKLLVMSAQAYKSLSQDQLNQILAHTEVLYSPLDTIEFCGGGSARCMMAEIFLPGEDVPDSPC